MSFDFDDNPWPTSPTMEGHPLVQKIRNFVMQYRLQSAAHFDVDIRVRQAISQTEAILVAEVDRRFRINVEFRDCRRPVVRSCRLVFRKSKDLKIVPTKRIQVQDGGRATVLNAFVAKHFPPPEGPVSEATMQGWWAGNGKTFNWQGMPTELKETVIRHCVGQPYEFLAYRQMMKYKSQRRDHGGVHEVTQRLTEWASLLSVSHQVRTITLRLCFIGSGAMAHDGEFSLTTILYYHFENAIHRLGRYYQMTEPDSVPTDGPTQALAERYSQFPQIYPNLQQYANFRHGLRKVNLGMDFMSYLRFFKVTVGGFRRYWKPTDTTYEIFQCLPHLKTIEFCLPLQPQKGWYNKPHLFGPRLFHNTDPCPRMLHRVIYERIAEVLASYNVEVWNFGDYEEKVRYDSLREAAVSQLKFTSADWEELYAECGGGVQLNDPVQQGVWESRVIDDNYDYQNHNVSGIAGDDQTFFPPKCNCEMRCFLLYNKKERKRSR